LHQNHIKYRTAADKTHMTQLEAGINNLIEENQKQLNVWLANQD